MTILSATEIRTHIETDLADVALDRLLNGAEALIVGVTGVIATQTDFLTGGVNIPVYTTRAISSITTIKERDYPDDTEVTLSADDYRLQGGFRLLRLREGTNPRLFWAKYVEVAYAPNVNTGLVESVQIVLMKHAVTYSGTQRETNGDFDFWHPDTAKEIKAALLPLSISSMRMPLR